jgi:hypothetical protein
VRRQSLPLLPRARRTCRLAWRPDGRSRPARVAHQPLVCLHNAPQHITLTFLCSKYSFESSSSSSHTAGRVRGPISGPRTVCVHVLRKEA